MKFPFSLYESPNSYQCTAVKMALDECKIAYTSVLIDSQNSLTKSFLKKSPFGRLPVLVEHRDAGDIIVRETPAILFYLGERFKSTEFYCEDLLWKSSAFSWISFFDSELQRVLLNASQERGLLERYLKAIDGQLTQRAFLVGDYSIADIAASPLMHAIKQSDQDLLESFKYLFSWYKRLQTRSCYQKVLQAKR